MHETDADIDRLQALLDESMANAGAHLTSIVTPDRRLSARDVADRLTGMTLLALATVTSDGRPLVGAVDGIFYRGSYYFGSSPDSVRFRHIRHRPDVSATHLPGEHLAVTVHGRAVPIDIMSADAAGFRQTVLDIYTPRYGKQWETEILAAGAMYARIDARRIFTFHFEE